MSARRNEIAASELETLRCGLRVAGQVVQERHNPSAELVDFGKCVGLAACVLRLQGLAILELNLARREAPRTGLLRVLKLQDERVERDTSVAADARAWTNPCVECCGVALVLYF